jgi:Domain of unknown function (DUF4440)
MRKCVVLLLSGITLLTVRCGLSQTPAATQLQTQRITAEMREEAKERDVREEELINLEKETAHALQWNTGTFFRRVYGDEFEGIVPGGQVLKKAAWIAAVENSNVKYSMFLASDIRVKMYEDTAVVTCLWSSRGVRNGKEFSRQSRVTHVYVYGQRGWQAVASQETLLPG